ECHDRLLPVGPAPAETAHAAHLAPGRDRVHLRDLNVEQLFDRPANLGLRRIPADDERVLALADAVHALLGDHRAEDDVVRRRHEASTSSIRRTASRVRTRRPCTRTWRALRSAATAASTPSRLRAASRTVVSGSASTSSGLWSAMFNRSSTARISRVFGAGSVRPSTTISSPSRSLAVSAAR